MLRWPQSVHSKGKNVLLGDNDSNELEVKTATDHSGYHMPLNQQAKKGVTVLAGVVDLDYQAETVACYITMEIKKSMS